MGGDSVMNTLFHLRAAALWNDCRMHFFAGPRRAGHAEHRQFLNPLNPTIVMLHGFRRHIFARRSHNQFFNAPRNPDKSIPVDMADVARTQPAAFTKDLGGERAAHITVRWIPKGQSDG